MITVKKNRVSERTSWDRGKETITEYTIFQALKLFVYKIREAVSYRISDDSIELSSLSPSFDSTGPTDLWFITLSFSGTKEDMRVLFSYSYYFLLLVKEILPYKLAASKEEAFEEYHSKIYALMSSDSSSQSEELLGEKKKLYDEMLSKLMLLSVENSVLRDWDLLEPEEKFSSSSALNIVKGAWLALEKREPLPAELEERLQGAISLSNEFFKVFDDFIDTLEK